MPRGKNYVNNNKGVTLQASKKGKASQMIDCQYGSGCSRDDCIYRHPRGKNSDGGVGGTKRSAEPCMPYLAGVCSFTSSGCRKRHPPNAECERLIARYKSTRCRFGDGCKTFGCLYVHPRDEEEGEEEARRGASGMEEPAYMMPQEQSFPPLRAAAQAASVGTGAVSKSAAAASSGVGGMSAQAQTWAPGGWKVAPPGGSASSGAHGYAAPSGQQQYQYSQSQYSQSQYSQSQYSQSQYQRSQPQYYQQPQYQQQFDRPAASASAATPPSAGTPGVETPPTGMLNPSSDPWTASGSNFGGATPPTPGSQPNPW